MGFFLSYLCRLGLAETPLPTLPPPQFLLARWVLLLVSMYKQKFAVPFFSSILLSLIPSLLICTFF